MRMIRGQWSRAMVMTILCGLGLPNAAKAQEPAPGNFRPLVEIRTVLGTMVVALYNETPLHRDLFLAKVEAGDYDSLLFHRVVPGFAVEGGDPASKHAAAGLQLGLDTDTVGTPLEVVPGLIHKKGALAAAPAGDTPETARRSHGSRFYIVQGVPYDATELAQVAERNARHGTPFGYTEEDRHTYAELGGQPRLDGGYTVFGEVVEGLEVIDALIKEPCNLWDRPLTDIRMFMRVLK
ncbi:MAG TPA: peptidylprolyl isomerase [Flavobacteriales bacterium]|nr:peptidylprolyl isomerase [Flavobacteriales bacterium]